MSLREEKLEVGACSETGLVRDENQDRMSGTSVPIGQLYIVADGMGGHTGGALAAELTVQELQRYIGKASTNASVEEVIQAAFNGANETIYRKAHSKDPATEGMGSTAVLLLISGRVARLAHVGDSRAYLFRNGRLKQLTTDHTVVQRMVEAGMLKPEQAADHPNANVLVRAVGSKPTVEVDITDELVLNEGDAILLCSDGLSGYVADLEIEAVLRSQAKVQDIPERLVDLALSKGGEDNITVQFIQYGKRKEALTKLKENEAKRLHRIFQVVIVFALILALSILGFYNYSNLREIEKRLDESYNKKPDSEIMNFRNELDENKKKSESDVKKLQKKLDENKKKSENDVKKLQEKIDENKKKTESDIKKIQEKLSTIEQSSNTSKTRGHGLKENLKEKKDKKANNLKKPKEKVE